MRRNMLERRIKETEMEKRLRRQDDLAKWKRHVSCCFIIYFSTSFHGTNGDQEHN